MSGFDMPPFTPGPWRRCGGQLPKAMCIDSNQGYVVSSFADRTQDIEAGQGIVSAPDVGTQLANSWLIAAAPEMFNALQRACGYFWRPDSLREQT